MTSFNPLHPDDETLLRLIDQDLAPDETSDLNRHVGTCQECRRRFTRLRDTSGEYLRFHQSVLKKSLPPPPAEWTLGNRNVPAQPPVSAPVGPSLQFPIRKFPIKRWLAIAAAIVVALLLVRRLEQAPEVSAAELLQKAEAAERITVKSKRRIRIQTAGQSWVPTASLQAEDMAGVRRLFDEAGYSWEDPLSAAAYARWRERLPEKRDTVTTLPAAGPVESYVITTLTASSRLTEAKLTLRAEGLRAVACNLQFGSEQVDIVELPDEREGPPPVEPSVVSGTNIESPAGPPAESSSVPAGHAAELHAIVALHAIGADLGEPIEVSREGTGVLVTATGIDAERREQVRKAVSEISGVQFLAKDVPGESGLEGLPQRRRRPQRNDPDPLISELQGSPEFRDQLIDSTDTAIERIYALRALARRFPRETVERLAPDDNETLNGILLDHIDVLAATIPLIETALAPALPKSGAVSGDFAGSGWQGVTESMLASVQTLDHALNAGGESTEDITARKLRLAGALAELNRQMAVLRTMVRRPR